MSDLSRRSFLALGVGAAAWACSRKSSEEDGTSAQGARAISLVPTALQLAVGDSRNAIAVFRGQRPIVPKSMDVQLRAPKGKPFDVRLAREQIVRGPGGGDHAHPEDTEVDDIFVLHHRFDEAGIWVIDANVEGHRAQAAFQVVGSSEVSSPIVGQKAIGSESPTTSNPRGVDPLCTRTPKCSMHDSTIADAIAAGKPAVIVFATPRFCTSRTCGPVVDFVEDAKDEVGDQASFVHIEVWRNDDDAVGKPGGDSPTFAEWKLGTEPWIYFVDGDATVKDRWLGAAGKAEIRRAVDALVG
jgi:hypothetical protein